jgi:hypothetical protein
MIDGLLWCYYSKDDIVKMEYICDQYNRYCYFFNIMFAQILLGVKKLVKNSASKYIQWLLSLPKYSQIASMLPK